MKDLAARTNTLTQRVTCLRRYFGSMTFSPGT